MKIQLHQWIKRIRSQVFARRSVYGWVSFLTSGTWIVFEKWSTLDFLTQKLTPFKPMLMLFLNQLFTFLIQYSIYFQFGLMIFGLTWIAVVAARAPLPQKAAFPPGMPRIMEKLIVVLSGKKPKLEPSIYADLSIPLDGSFVITWIVAKSNTDFHISFEATNCIVWIISKMTTGIQCGYSIKNPNDEARVTILVLDTSSPWSVAVVNLPL